MNPLLKQHLTQLYDRVLGMVAPIRRRSVWKNLDDELANHDYGVAHVATINYCNAKCNFCGQHKFKRPSGLMTQEMFEHIVDECLKMGIKELDFTPPLGDPLLDDKIFDKVGYARKKGIEILSITTNGIKLSGQNYRAMVNAFDNIRISLGGCTRAEYKAIYGVDKFDNVVTWILEMAKYIEYLRKWSLVNGQRKNILIFFRASSSWKEIKRSLLMEYLRPHIKAGYLRVEYTNFYDNWGGSIKPEDMLGEMKMRAAKKKRGVPCQSLKQFFVEHSGNVRLCGCRFKDKEDDDLVAGNIKKNSLAFILRSRSLSIYNRFKKGVDLPDVCKDCTLYRPII